MYKKLIAVVIPSLLLANNAMADYGSTSASIPIEVSVVQPLSLTVAKPITVDDAIAGLTVIDSEGQIDVQGEDNATVSLSVSNSTATIINQSDSSQTMTLDTAIVGNTNPALDGQGKLSFDVKASMASAIPASQASGQYSGSISVSVAYV